MAKRNKTPDDLLDEAMELRDKMIAEGGDSKAIAKYEPLIQAKMYEAALSYPELDENNIVSPLGLVDNQKRWKLFEQLCKKYVLSPKAFAVGLKYAWTTGIATGNPNVIRFFRKVDGRLMMDEEEQQYFDKLPGVVTIYRGCHINELNYWDDNSKDNSCLGISWTTDRGVAEFFAFRHTKEDRLVVRLDVVKSSIVTFINERSEYECIYLLAFLVKPMIVTKKPTSYFKKYMERRNSNNF